MQDFVGLAQLANLALQRLNLVGNLARDAGALAAVDLCLLHQPMLRMRNAADFVAINATAASREG